MRFPEAQSFVESDDAYSILQDTGNGIVAFAVGRKHGGAVTKGSKFDFCITAFVKKILPRDELSLKKIPDAFSLCRQFAQRLHIFIEREDFNVVEAGGAVELQPYSGSSHSCPAGTNTQKWFAGLRPGIGIANPEGSYPLSLDGGTIAFFVKRDEPSDIFLVSCNHVIARERTSWAASKVPSELVMQPATMDLSGKDITDYQKVSDLRSFGIGYLAAFVDVQTHSPSASSAPANVVDAAIARVIHCRESSLEKLGRMPYGGRLLGTDQYTWDENSEEIQGSSDVFKCGRTTGYTEGIVTHVKGVATIDFAGRKARFVNQLVVQPTPDNTGKFSQPGDSGSAIINEYHKVVGMLFAGTLRQSWATPVQEVLKALSSANDDSGRAIGQLDLIC